MPNLLTRILVPPALPECGPALARDIHFIATRAILRGLALAIGVQVCLDLGGNATHAAWMHTAMHVGLLASMFYVEFGRGQSPLKMLFWPEAAACALLVAVAVLASQAPGAGTATTFAAIIGLSVALSALSMPFVSTVYAYVYPEKVRGSIVSYTRLTHSIMSIVGLLVLGRLVSAEPASIWVMFPVAGLLGIWAVRRFSTMKLPPIEVGRRERLGRGLGFLRVLARDKAFARFQLFQFTLGCANLMAIPMLAVYVREELKLGVGLAVLVVAQGVVESIALLVSVRLHGWLFDRIGVIWHRVITSLLIASGFVIWAFADALWIGVIAGVLIGLGRAGGQIIWIIGSLQFAPKGEESLYSGVHTFLTGLRGVLAPLLGLLLLETCYGGNYQLFFFTVVGMILLSTVGHAFFVPALNRPQPVTAPPPREPQPADDCNFKCEC